MESIHILLVEDQLSTANAIRETLENAGHHVTAIALSFQEAVAVVRHPPPDLAIVGIHLVGSVADGITTAEALVAIHPMPIIYLTAHLEADVFQRAKKTLPAAYLLNPFRPAELVLQVELAYYNYRINQKKSFDIGAETDRLFLPINKGYEQILKSDVVFLQAEGSYVNIFLRQKNAPLLLSMNLGYISEYFDTSNFYRLSRSLLININYLERLEGSSLFMHNHKFPIQLSENSRAELMKKLAVVRTR